MRKYIYRIKQSLSSSILNKFILYPKDIKVPFKPSDTVKMTSYYLLCEVNDH